MQIPDRLRAKYDEERDKRLRPQKLGQYSDFRDDSLRDLDVDPWADHDALASKGFPLRDGAEVKVLVLGAGFFGLMVTHRLITDAGISNRDIVLVDKAGGIGGTWYWNRYPGVTCDIEAYCYLPLLEETGYMPRERYAPGHEIREHCERIAARWDMQAQLCTRVVSQDWDDDARRWVVKLRRDLGPGRGEQELTVRAQFLVVNGGPITAPHVPTLNGVDVFRSAPGKALMHTGRWDWSRSGGSQQQPDLSRFAGKKVGVVGTGATGIQLMPHVARWAEHTYVFQRTPSYVGSQMQGTTTPEDWARVAGKKGWQYERIASLDAMFTGTRGAEDLVQDCWTRVLGVPAAMGREGKPIQEADEKDHADEMLRLDYPWTEEMRARVDAIVRDAATAEALKAWYPGYCKRPAFNNEYLDLFNRPDVTLVDTNGRGVEAYTAGGVKANGGQEYELDVLILATGYSTGIIDSSPCSTAGVALLGREGRSLKSKWNGDDFGTLFGHMTNGFPNLFFFTASGSAISHNAVSRYTTAARGIAYMVREAIERSADPSRVSVEVSKEAEDEWSVKVNERARWFTPTFDCTPSYINGEGLMREETAKRKTEEERFQFGKRSLWGGGILSYQAVVDEWMSTGGMAGVHVD